MTLAETHSVAIRALRRYGTPAEWAEAERDAREGRLWLVVDVGCPLHTDWLVTASSAEGALDLVAAEESCTTEGLEAVPVGPTVY